LLRIWLSVLFVSLYLFKLGGAGFLGPDEPRYASIGREMARSGDWITPRLNGSPWFEKPPLIYWTTAAANRAGLRDEWAARLPVALMSVTFLVFYFEALRREFSLRLALTAAVILGGSAGWLTASFAAVPDLPMAAALGAAMLLGLFGTSPRRGWLTGVLLGLAVLAKGFIPLLLFAPVWLIARGKRLAILAAAFIIAAPWFSLCLMRNGTAFWNDFFWKHHVERLLSADVLRHGEPFWYYIPVLLAGLFPWTPLTILALRAKTYADVRVRFLSIWSLGALVFFSLVPNKLPLYILPTLPALAVVLAVAWDKAPRREWWLAACALMLVLLPSIGEALPDAFRLGARRTHWTFNSRGLLFAAAAAVVWWLALRERLTEAVLVTAAAVAAGVGYLKLRTLPVLDERDSVRAFWRAHQPEIIQSCVDQRVSRTKLYGLEYYAAQALPECDTAQSSGVRIEDTGGSLALKSGIF
jgi:4-amino-4-deoxy-L-arabinose transferase-like glycosyltransferase